MWHRMESTLHTKGRKVDNLCIALLKHMAKGSPAISLDSDHMPAEPFRSLGALEESSKF